MADIHFCAYHFCSGIEASCLMSVKTNPFRLLWVDVNDKMSVCGEQGTCRNISEKAGTITLGNKYVVICNYNGLL